jgi:hypothetical protein
LKEPSTILTVNIPSNDRASRMEYLLYNINRMYTKAMKDIPFSSNKKSPSDGTFTLDCPSLPTISCALVTRTFVDKNKLISTVV